MVSLYRFIAKTVVMALCCGFVSCNGTQSSQVKDCIDTISTEIITNPAHVKKPAIHVERRFNMFFLGHEIDCNTDSVYYAFNKAFANDKNVSFNIKSVNITICGTTFHVNEDGTILMSSVQPESEAMKKVVKYLNKFYGEAYEQSPDDYIWPAFRDSTLDQRRYPNIHLRRTRGEDGGTAIIIM